MSNSSNYTKDVIVFFDGRYKTHKGTIRGIGYGFSEFGDKEIFLTLAFKRIKYDHEIDTHQPIIVYGFIPNETQNIINDINIKRHANKYNL